MVSHYRRILYLKSLGLEVLFRIISMNYKEGYIEIKKTLKWERSGSVVECLTRDRGASGFVPHRRHCVVSLSKNINPSLVLVQPRKTGSYITERLLMGCKESNQTNKTKHYYIQSFSLSNRFWECKRNVSMRCFFYSPKTYVIIDSY